MAARLLFCLKHRDHPWGHYGSHLSSGLRNSVCFIIELLELLGIACELVELIDNNAIDAAVTKFKPTHVFIEAFWVVPTKFDVLKKLHPLVTWIVRDHSETPFVANEGIAMGWIAGYLARGVEVSCNAPRALVDLQAVGTAMGHPKLISYSPNWYPVENAKPVSHLVPHPAHADDTVRVGCFGAIRPLKNHLVQAIAAIRYAETLGKKLEFHVNATRVEQGGNPILNNLRGLFAAVPRATLVESGWLEHDAFLVLLRSMDLCLQVSFSETFNIVSADAVAQSVPVVVSREVPWLQAYAIADPNSSASILTQMLAVHKQPAAARLAWQWRDLTNYANKTKAAWKARFG